MSDEAGFCRCGHSYLGHAAGRFSPADGFRGCPKGERGLCLWCGCEKFERDDSEKVKPMSDIKIVISSEQLKRKEVAAAVTRLSRLILTKPQTKKRTR